MFALRRVGAPVTTTRRVALQCFRSLGTETNVKDTQKNETAPELKIPTITLLNQTIKEDLEVLKSAPVMETPTGPFKILYRVSQAKTIRVLMGASCVNFCYWGALLSNYFIGDGTFLGSTTLGSGGVWGTFGILMTGAIMYVTRNYAHQSIYCAAVSPDDSRISLQVHNVMGLPGRKYETATSRARILNPSSFDKTHSKLSSGSIDVLVDGLTAPLLIQPNHLKSTPLGRHLSRLLVQHHPDYMHMMTKLHRKEATTKHKK